LPAAAIRNVFFWEAERDSMTASLSRPSSSTRRRRWLAFPAAVAVIGLAAAGWWRWQAGTGDEAARWVTAPVTQGDIEDTTTALGTLQPYEYVDVGTQVSGQLRRIPVKLGDRVEPGQLLAEIDPTLYASRVDADQAQLLNLRAQLAEKQAQQQLAGEQFDRQQRMLKANATSQDAFQSAQAAIKTATAQVAQLNAQIQQVESTLKGDQANLGYTKIYAPMAGTVVTLQARQGQTLNANQQAPIILRIADLKTMTVWTQVSEADVGRLKLGQDAYFTTLGRPDHRWYGHLRQILPTPEVINNVVLYDALFDVDNADGTLGIQMSTQVFFVHAAAQGALLVPVSALTMAGGGPGKGKPRAKDPANGNGMTGIERVGGAAVLVMEGGKPVRRAVTVGVRNRVQAEIVSGLKAGEEVVIGRRQAGAEQKPAQPIGRPRL
jgi:macrolide-specific efflux system membrane fusion protein